MVVGWRRTVAAGLVFAATLAFGQEQSLTASVDRSSIRENESFTYVLRAEGRIAGEPDVSALEKDFDVLNRSTSARIQTINGRTEQVAEYIYQLMPRTAGEFTLPPIELDGLVSNPVPLTVEPVVVDKDAPADIFMEVEVDPAAAYVQAQIVYTLRLFVGVGIGRATLTQPLVSGGEAIIERLGEDRQYQTTRAGRTFTVRERRYAVFPQAPGMLTIGPSVFEAMVIPNRGFSRTQRLRSETIDVEVRPAVAPPPEHPNAVWLPARDLELTESWTDDSDQFALGVPRTRVLTVVADGLLETQIPELDIGTAAGVRQYPDQPELERQVTDAGLEATRVERYAVIAQTVGDATIPPAELPWWNVVDERWEVARVPGATVSVVQGNEALPSAPDQSLPAAAPAPIVETRPGVWPWVAAALALGWLLTVLGWWRSSRSASTRESVAAAQRPLSPRALVRQLRAACAVGDAARAQQLLLEWGRAHYPDAAPGSLGALAEISGGELGTAVAGLEAHLYGRTGADWDPGRLADLVAAAGAGPRDRPAADDDPFEPLYR